MRESFQERDTEDALLEGMSVGEIGKRDVVFIQTCFKPFRKLDACNKGFMSEHDSFGIPSSPGSVAEHVEILRNWFLEGDLAKMLLSNL